MGYQKVIVKINKASGKMSIEADGFVGTQCDQISEIEAKLGSVTHTEDKPERYQYINPDVVPNYLG